MPTLRSIREAAGVTQIQVAVKTGTSVPSVHVFEESDGRAVRHPKKKAALRKEYADMAARVGGGDTAPHSAA